MVEELAAESKGDLLSSYNFENPQQKSKKKALTWDQCTFTSILPSLKDDIQKQEASEGQTWSAPSFQQQRFTTQGPHHDGKQQNSATNIATSKNFDPVSRSTSPVGGDDQSSTSPSSACSSTTASTNSAQGETPPTSPGRAPDALKVSSVAPPPVFSRSNFGVGSRGFADVATDLETIAEDPAGSGKDSPRFINRRRVTLGANLESMEYAEAMASRLVSGFYSKPADGVSNRRNSSFEVQGGGDSSGSKLFGWTGGAIKKQGSFEMGDEQQTDIDVEALRKQVDSWRTFFAVDETEDEEKFISKPPTPSRRHSTPPIHISPNPSVGMSIQPNAAPFTPAGANNNAQYNHHVSAGIHENMPMNNGLPMPPPPPVPIPMHQSQYGYNNPAMHRPSMNPPPFQHPPSPAEYQRWTEWMNYMNYYSQQPPMMDGGYVEQQQQNTSQVHRGGRRGSNKRSGGNGQLCEALSEFRATGNRPSMEALIGHVVEFSRDSHGSRFIQFKMETSSPQEKQILVDEIVVEAVALASHPFGNYVIQNFLLHGNGEQKYAIARTFQGHMVKLSTQAHGCRVVQHAIDVLDMAQRNLLLCEIVENITSVAKNNHGTHVVQKCMSILLNEKDRNCDDLCRQMNSPTSKELLLLVEQSVGREILRLSVHPHSYRLVQQALGNCDPKRSNAVGDMMQTVERNYHALAVDQHGNFILQHILDNGSLQQVGNVQAFVCSRVLELSQHKFGSHLVEKCLASATEGQARAIVEQLLEPTGHNAEYKASMSGNTDSSSTLLLLSKDPYANFVVQRAFDASSGDMRARIAHDIRQRSDVLSRYTYGRHILSHINRSDV